MTRAPTLTLPAAPEAPAPAGRRRLSLDVGASPAWALALYALLSVLLLGLPVIGHLQSRVIAADQIDSSQFMWSFAWWPHALLNGLNPFVTHAQFVPDGFNITWTPTVPLAGVLFSPVTLALGPAVTWNLVQLLAPALSAWTAFLLCRHITRRVGPSLVGGYVFGFSPFVIEHVTGGPYLALVPMVPLFVLLVLRRLEGSLSPRRFVVAMTAALTAQFLISTEVLTTSTLFGAGALIVALALFGEHRRALVRLVPLLLGAYAATAVLVSPFLYFFFFGHQYPPGATYFTADLAGFVLPPPLVELTRGHTLASAFRGANTETYLGLPLLVLIAVFAWERRRNRTTWLVVTCLLLAAVASLGGRLIVRGHLTGIWLPWSLFAHLPVLRYAITLRFALFTVLIGGVIVAMWLARGRSVARWSLAALVVASFLPNVGNAAWHTNIHDPAFFSSGAYRAYLKPADHVLTVPPWGPNERWQADTKFGFELAAGYLGNPFPAGYARYPTWNTLLTGRLTPDYAVQLHRFVTDKGVTAIVVDRTYTGPWTTLFGTLGVRPTQTGGVLVYRLRPAGRG
jgi:hypothetical protein